MTEEIAGRDMPACYNMGSLFFSPEDDGRQEQGRKERENFCKEICRSCKYEVACLWRAVRNGEYYGVWGGTGEADRREFVEHMRSEGYDTVPDLEDFDEFVAVWCSFWRGRGSPRTIDG